MPVSNIYYLFTFRLQARYLLLDCFPCRFIEHLVVCWCVTGKYFPNLNLLPNNWDFLAQENRTVMKTYMWMSLWTWLYKAICVIFLLMATKFYGTGDFSVFMWYIYILCKYQWTFIESSEKAQKTRSLSESGYCFKQQSPWMLSAASREDTF